MPSEVGFSVVICGSSPISRSALPGLGPRANLRALPSAATKASSTPAPDHLHQPAQAFARHQHDVIKWLFDAPPDPGFDRRRVRRVVDGEHRTLQHVGALLGEQAGKLRFLARFQDQDAVTVQSVSHDLAPTLLLRALFILTPVSGLAQAWAR
jgi:hypothetical protein